MTRCSVCESIDDVADDPRTAQPLCASCRRLSLRELTRRLVWRATTDLDADDREHERRIEASERLVAALRRAVLAVLAACLTACTSPSPTAGDALLVAFLLFVFVALCAATERLLAALTKGC